MKPDSPEQNRQGWPQPNQFKKSIRLEFTLFVSVIILLLMFVTGYVLTQRFVESTTRNVVEKLLVQARSYSGPAGKHIISANGPDALMLNNICKKLDRDNADVIWTGVTDKRREFLAHTDISQVVAQKSLPELQTDEYRDLLSAGEVFAARGDTLLLIVPITENDLTVGYLGIASSNRQIIAAREASILSVVSITLIMILVGLPLTLLAVNHKLKPIKIITENLQAVNYDDINIDIPLRSSNEFGYLAETLHVMGDRLNTAQKDKLERERIQREFEIASEIQKNILPRTFPSGAKYDFSGYYSSAREVGGDYYDFIEIDADRIGFLVADVSGKSLPGMLVMLLTRDIVRQYARTGLEPEALMSKINGDLIGNIKRGMFVTMFYGILNARTGHFTFASAGHNPLAYYDARKDEVSLLKTKGFPLGMMPNNQFSKRIETGEIVLGANDWLIQYTDGINEAHNAAKEEFGMDRFLELIQRARQEQPETLIDRVIAGLTQFVADAEQYDDITLVAMKWFGAAQRNAESKIGVLAGGN
ncbi:MAG: PP2C family protein-serine/threonine phosphatase [Candidatus Zixiibacteriota bacterium]